MTPQRVVVIGGQTVLVTVCPPGCAVEPIKFEPFERGLEPREELDPLDVLRVAPYRWLARLHQTQR